MKREFYVDTPIGKLRIHAKHSEDYADDYPGVFIDLVRANNELQGIACVEYNSCRNYLQTCVYNPDNDEPVAIVAHQIREGK